jgi:hypothetical protein
MLISPILAVHDVEHRCAARLNLDILSESSLPFAAKRQIIPLLKNSDLGGCVLCEKHVSCDVCACSSPHARHMNA